MSFPNFIVAAASLAFAAAGVCASIAYSRRSNKLDSEWQADTERRKAILSSSGFTADIEPLPPEVRKARQEFMEDARWGR